MRTTTWTTRALLALATLCSCAPGASPDDARAADAPADAPLDAIRPAADASAETDAAAADAPAADAAPEAGCDRPDGGGACTPGRVACGAVECAVPAAYCCITADAGPGCAAADASCQSAVVEIRCDEAADCPAGQVCCAGRGADHPYQACAAACGAFEQQLCRTNSECADGTGPCVLNDCGGFVVQSCGPLPRQSGCTPR